MSPEMSTLRNEIRVAVDNTLEEPAPEVTAALSEVLRYVKVGAQPLSLSETTLEALRREWLPDFHEQLVDEGIQWTDARETVIHLAEQVGRYARVLTVGKWASAGGQLPTEIDTACAKLAGYLVASNSPNCIAANEIRPRGKFCKGFTNPAGEDRAKALDDLIKRLPRLPGPANLPQPAPLHRVR